jgi:uncharacterized membrane protein YphA (DoxX/SURF4 family)
MRAPNPNPMSSGGTTGPSWGLVVVRIVCGVIMLVAGWGKLVHGVDDSLVQSTTQAFAEAPAIVRAWGESIVLPHPWFFSHLIMLGEFVGGLALFLGAFTRPAGYAGAFMFANFFFAGPESMRMFVLLLTACCLGCAISRAGDRSGADVFLTERCPMWMTWVRR